MPLQQESPDHRPVVPYWLRDDYPYHGLDRAVYCLHLHRVLHLVRPLDDSGIDRTWILARRHSSCEALLLPVSAL